MDPPASVSTPPPSKAIGWVDGLSYSKIYFITGKKRFLLCINFIKYLVLLYCKRKKKNINYKFFLPLSNYLINDKGSLVSKVKYKIYKKKLIQMQS